MTKYYLTTPIYYPSDDLHIGHAYTTVAADALARYHRLLGQEVFFLTGTDEHGQKIERRAREEGLSPQVFVDRIVERIQILWSRLGISYDDFIRTTEERHVRVIQEIFRQLLEQGDIYKAEYEGWYCTPCESFWPEAKLVAGNCPDCGRPVERLREESYFFRLSRYQDQLLKHIEENPDFIQPVSRRNEMLAFIRSGLEDLSVSRTSFTWGIPLPGDPRHIAYVWVDALSNYLTGVGYLSDEEKFQRFWPADLHLVGKEIVRFHAVIWPIILLALGLPLPKMIYGHGWLLLGDTKMSKSRGNVIDPNVLIDKYGRDAVRYYLLREVPFGADGSYTEEALILRTNVDLANDLGNLLHRSLSMIERFGGGVVPAPGGESGLEPTAREALSGYHEAMASLQLPLALQSLWRLVSRANKYIEETSPWKLAKENDPRLGTVLYDLAEALRLLAVALSPFIPDAAGTMWGQLGLTGTPTAGGEAALNWGIFASGEKTRRGEPIFPRIEVEIQISSDVQAEATVTRSGRSPAGKKEEPVPPEPSPNLDDHLKPTNVLASNTESTATSKPVPEPVYIDYEDFSKWDLRVAEVRAAEIVQGADRLLKLTLDLGGEERTVVSGIRAAYGPEEMVGKQVVLLANLKPATIRGIRSEGMILAAGGEKLALIAPDKSVTPGSRVK